MTQKPFKLLFIATFLMMGAVSAHAQFNKNATCPVMPGTAVKEKFYVNYQGERVYLCCRACVKAFKKHPEKYLKNLNP